MKVNNVSMTGPDHVFSDVINQAVDFIQTSSSSTDLNDLYKYATELVLLKFRYEKSDEATIRDARNVVHRFFRELAERYQGSRELEKILITMDEHCQVTQHKDDPSRLQLEIFPVLDCHDQYIKDHDADALIEAFKAVYNHSKLNGAPLESLVAFDAHFFKRYQGDAKVMVLRDTFYRKQTLPAFDQYPEGFGDQLDAFLIARDHATAEQHRGEDGPAYLEFLQAKQELNGRVSQIENFIEYYWSTHSE